MKASPTNPESFTESSRDLALKVRKSDIDASGELPDSRFLHVITWRGGATELALGREYCASPDPLDRVLGTLILAQLGWPQGGTFIAESLDLLIPLLEDEDARVVSGAATAFGHRKDPRAVPHLVRLAGHPDSSVRVGVAFGLLTQEAPEAVNCLIEMSRDSNPDVRNWAVFGLGSQIEDIDTPEIRMALCDALSDSDPEVVAEAMIGLAEREDSRVVPALLERIGWIKGSAGERPAELALRAAFVIGDPRLIPALETLERDRKDAMEGEGLHGTPALKGLRDALKRCRGEINRYYEPVPTG